MYKRRIHDNACCLVCIYAMSIVFYRNSVILMQSELGDPRVQCAICVILSNPIHNERQI